MSTIPRMRTAAGALEEIKRLDPHTNITESSIRRIMKRGLIDVVPNGRKHLINVDKLLEYFDEDGTMRIGEEAVS